MNETDNSVAQVKELLLENRRVSLSWEFHSGKCRAFWKKSEHIRLLQNSCTTCWV